MKKAFLFILTIVAFSSIGLYAAQWCEDYTNCSGGFGCDNVVVVNACVLKCQAGGFANCILTHAY